MLRYPLDPPGPSRPPVTGATPPTPHQPPKGLWKMGPNDPSPPPPPAQTFFPAGNAVA